MKIEAYTRKAEMELRKTELELELKRIEADKEIRMMELQGQQAEQNKPQEYGGRPIEMQAQQASGWEDSLAGKTKRYGDTLKHVLPQMPKEIGELPQFFHRVEKLYSIYQVPENFQAKLLITLLTDRAKSVIGGMSAADIENYDEL